MSPLFLLILLPLAAAAIAVVVGRARLVSCVAAAVNLLIAIALVLGHLDNPAQGLAHVGSVVLLDYPPIHLSVGADGLSLLMSLLCALVTMAAAWQVDEAKASALGEHVSLLLISGGAMGAFLCRDLILLYAFHELALIPTLLMIALHGRGEAAERGRVAWKTTLYLGAASLVLLVGLCALLFSLNVGQPQMTTNLDALKALATAKPLATASQAAIASVLLVGFGALVSLFPFHTWAAPAYATAPVSVAMMHSGVLKKFGIYGILRVVLPLLPEGLSQPWLAQALQWALLGNILWVGYVCVHQRNLGDLLAHSSVMHMGYLFLGIAAATPLALQGVGLLAFAHGISIALLFGLAGRMRSQLGTLEMRRLGGLGAHAPAVCVLFAFGMFASIGLPGLANFAGEAMVFLGCFAKPGQMDLGPLQFTAIAALWGVVVSAVYGLRAFRNLFQGTAQGGLFMSDPPWGQRLPSMVLAAALLVVGCCPWLALRVLAPSGAPTAAAKAPLEKTH